LQYAISVSTGVIEPSLLLFFLTSQPRAAGATLSYVALSLIVNKFTPAPRLPFSLSLHPVHRRGGDLSRRKRDESKLPTGGDELPANPTLGSSLEADFSAALIVNAIFIASR